MSGTFATLARLPQDLQALRRRARYGRVQVNVEIVHLKRVDDQLDRAASRLVVALRVAALIIGSSIIMTVGGGPRLSDLPALGLLGFVAAAVSGLCLLRSIGRDRRRQDDEG